MRGGILDESDVITSPYNHFIIMRTHRWPYGPCFCSSSVIHPFVHPPVLFSFWAAVQKGLMSCTHDNFPVSVCPSVRGRRRALERIREDQIGSELHSRSLIFCAFLHPLLSRTPIFSHSHFLALFLAQQRCCEDDEARTM